MADIGHPQFLALVERKHQWESSWTSTTTYLSGAVSSLFDAARTLLLTVPNSNGKATDDWKPGDRVRVSLGWNRKEALPVFEGVVPPGRGLQLAGVTLRIFAVDPIGLLTADRMVVDATQAKVGTDETTYVGWEAAMALRDVLATSSSASLFGDLGGIRGTNPILRVGFEVEEPIGFLTRKQYIDQVLAQLDDDEVNPDRPKRYHYWMDAKADGTPAVYLTKEQDPTTAPVVRTISHLVDLIAAKVDLRSDQATSAVARSSSDATIWRRFQDDESVTRYGRPETVLTVPSTNTDDLDAAARRYVNAQRFPIRPLEVIVRDGLRHSLNQVVEIVNPRYGGSGNFLVTGVNHQFSPASCETHLQLSTPEELITEALTA